MIQVIAKPHPIQTEIVQATAPAGSTILDIVGGHLEDVEVFIGGGRRLQDAGSFEEIVRDWHVLREHWHVVKPKDGHTVYIAKVAQDDAIGGIIGIIAVSALAFFGGPAIAGAVGLAGQSLTIAGASISYSTLFSAAIGLVGSIALNALVSPQMPSPDGGGSQFNRLATITGQSNQVNPFGVIPKLYGTHRIYPIIPMTALPFTEIVGNDQFLRWKGVLGYGPLEIGGVKAGGGAEHVIRETDVLSGTPIKIGETPIAEFEDVEFLIGEAKHVNVGSIYTDQVLSEQIGVVYDTDTSHIDDGAINVTVEDGTSAVRTTETDCVEIAVDMIYQGGLYSVDSSGTFTRARADHLIEYAPTGTNNWTALPPRVVGSGPFADQPSDDVNERHATGRGGDRETFRVGRRWQVPKGQYDVRITRQRVRHGDFEGPAANAMTWAQLKSYRERNAFDVDNVVVMDLRIKATDQLGQGPLDRVNILATSMLQKWDGAAWTGPVATDNPAWVYADIFAGNANERAILRSQIDGDALLDWANDADSKGLGFSTVVDQAGTVLDRAREVASTGRASWAIQQNTVTVVSDFDTPTPQLTVSPRTAWGFKEIFSFPDTPHGLRVTFTDPDTWEKTERLVFDDGFTEANATKYETLETRGVVNADQAYKEGRYRLAEKRLRPTRMEFSQDVISLTYRRGDVIELIYDVIAVGSGSGRITAVTTDGNGDVTVFETDETLFMESGEEYVVKVQGIDGNGDPVIRTSGITTVSPSTTTVTLDTPLSDIGVGDHWVFGVGGQETATVKVQSIAPQGDLTAKVTAVPAADAIHDADTGPIPAWDAKITDPVDLQKLPSPVPVIENIRSDETVLLRDADGSLRVRLVVAYVLPDGITPASRIEMRYRNSESDQWRRVATEDVSDGVFATTEVTQGIEYTIQLRSIGVNGRASSWASAQTHTIVGKSTPPPDLDDFTIARLANGTRRFEWSMASTPPIDVRFGGGYEIRYQTGSDGTWATATPLFDGLIQNSPLETDQLAAGTYTFLIKAIDSTGNESVNALAIVVDLGNPPLENVILQRMEPNEGWPGTKTDAHVEGARLVADGTGTWSDMANTWSALPDTWDALSDPADPIAYETPVIDIGAEASFTPLVTVISEGTHTITFKTGTDADGGVTGSFGSLEQVNNVRFVQFRVDVNGGDPNIIRGLTILLDGETILETYEDVDTSVATDSWFNSIAAGHFQIGSQEGDIAAVTRASIRALQNVSGGWSWTLVNKSSMVNGHPAAEFKVFDGTGSLADAVVDVELVGPKA